MLAKKVLRNCLGLNSRIREQMTIYRDWKSMAMEIDEDEVHEIVEAAWNVTGIIKLTGSEQAPKNVCRDRIIGTQKCWNIYSNLLQGNVFRESRNV